MFLVILILVLKQIHEKASQMDNIRGSLSLSYTHTHSYF